MRLASTRTGPPWIALPGLLGAIAAFVIPGSSGTTAAGATLLAVGALAILAGHTWGLLVAVPAHVTLVGRLWPTLAMGTPDVAVDGAITIVLVTSLPALILAALLLPRMGKVVLADSTPRMQSAFVTCCGALLAVSLVAPAF
jgi:hypothetical protein